MYKLAIVTSHPIQYNAPWFKLLADSGKVRPKVFYTWGESGQGRKYDPDFRREIEWNIPLLEGYEYTFVKNIAKVPGSHHFKGLINPTLNDEIMEWGPDAVLVYGWNFHSHLRCMRFFHRKVPVLFRGDSNLLDEQPGVKKEIRRLFLKWVYRHVDYALYVGSNNRKYYLIHGLREDQLVYAPHAIDNERFAEPDDDYCREAKEWREELGISDEDLVVLFSGKFESKKDPFFLIELAKRVSDPRLKIIFTGNGILENLLKEAAQNDARIKFLEFQNQLKMPVVYRLSDIFMLPSRGPGETWGLGANEAMASGCVIMLSDKVGGAIDLIQEGKNGIIFRAGDLKKCKALLEKMLDNREELIKMKKISRELVRSWSYQRIVTAIGELMDKI
ncbi:MAG TPA: glycosyltransferase family 4 protein [Puia sp.]|nr:glycosyltransferase family 4 protein [Puia sp.]